MDLGIFLIIGLCLSGLLAIQPKLPIVFITSVYWFVLLLWSLDQYHLFSLHTISWVSLLSISINYYIDALTKLFTLLISGIGILVLFYAYIYTSNEIYKRPKLLALIQLFAIAMLGIVLANDMIMLFLCWELTTLTSYLLIQFDTKDLSANKAAFNSLFITVLGSLAMLIGFLLLENLSGSWSIERTISQLSVETISPQFTFILGLILLGIITKSAQFPFYFWLPGAMKAPTPVSAYLHSATMVNAGIYLLARLHPLFSQHSLWYPLLAFFGLTTMVISSILSVLQNDFKSLLAYTTLFALGVMVYLLGSDQTLAIEAFAIFFLFHGIYKAAAFMIVGIIDKEYDTRKLDELAGIARLRPLLTITVVIILGSMAGLPPFFGFTAKEMIFEAKLAGPSISYFLIIISMLSSILIATASFRCLWFLLKPAKKPRAKIKTMNFGLICPAILAGLILFLSFLDEVMRNLIKSTIEAIVPMAEAIYANPNTRVTFLLSLSTVFGGGVLFILSLLVKKLPSHWPDFLNPRIIFENGLKNALLLGKQLTFITQGQPLVIQLKIVFLSIVSFLLFIMVTIQWYGLINYQIFTINLASMPLSCFLILTAFSLFISHKFLYNLVSLSLIGLAVSFFFMINGAVDLAMTQLLVEVLTIIIVLIALRDLNLYEIDNYKSINPINVIISIGIGLYTTLMLLLLREIPFDNSLQNYYIKNGLLLANGKNIVNVILVDFRSLDTFGEVIVIIATAIGIWLLARKQHDNNS